MDFKSKFPVLHVVVVLHFVQPPLDYLSQPHRVDCSPGLTYKKCQIFTGDLLECVTVVIMRQNLGISDIFVGRNFISKRYVKF